MNWDDRFAGEDYLFDTAPAQFLERHSHRLSPESKVLVVADGEGRNAVWLAEQGHEVSAWDGSPVAIEKARRLTCIRGVNVSFGVQEAAAYRWPISRYNAVIGIFIQFAQPDLRDAMFRGMIQAVRPGGILMLHGYIVEQLKHGTGGPPVEENLYTESLLRDRFAETDILHLKTYEAELREGSGHVGRSALIDLVTRVPKATQPPC